MTAVHVHVKVDRIDRTFCGEHTTAERLELLTDPTARACYLDSCEPCFVSRFPQYATACRYVATPWFRRVVAEGDQASLPF